MPRVNRLRRALPANRLTQAQIDILVSGQPILNYQPHELFASPERERAAWQMYKSELMDDCHPGQRPWAFYKHDLQIDPPRHWYEELAVLEARGLLRNDEETRLEKLRNCLDPRQTEELFSVKYFHLHIAQLLTPGSDNFTVRSMGTKFTFAAGWHDRRGRLELAAKYHTLASMVETALQGAAQQPMPKGQVIQ